MKAPSPSSRDPLPTDSEATSIEFDDPSIDNLNAGYPPAGTTTPHSSRARSLALAASLALIAFSLRTPITSVGPILVEAVRATSLSPAGASVLTTLPSLCFGLFGPLAPLLARRVGSERALLVLLVLLTAGVAMRVVPSWQALYAGQILACFSIGLMNVLMPGVVKRDFPQHVALMTGIYSAAMCAGAAAAAAATVPAARAAEQLVGSGANGWTWALALWAIPAALATLVWTRHIPPRGMHAGRRIHTVRGLWRDPLAWQVTLFMGSQSSLAYIVFGWLATVLRMRGMSAVDAGLMLSLSVIAQTVLSMLLPLLTARLRDQRAVSVLGLLLTGVSLLGCFFAPLSTTWIWVLLLGAAQGTSFTMALTVIGLRSSDSHVAAQLSSMAQGVGYLIASCGPFVAGSLLHATGSLYSIAALCVAVCLVSAWFGYAAGRPMHVNAQIE
ncbi:CynX/NimT family MFS transporter [Paraburkholderia ginsengiterrae]|uniref:CynX/NimT family MFS transporter n=1 Tax=Paraburkholderia ginsengiterrae TaxID=1462993 RepID=UPI0009EF0BC7|nr:MFS transporter [Paraburkholderia ginsengiterrae]